MIENLIIMVKMICFSHQYSKESGFPSLDNDKVVSPQQAMQILFGR